MLYCTHIMKGFFLSVYTIYIPQLKSHMPNVKLSVMLSMSSKSVYKNFIQTLLNKMV